MLQQQDSVILRFLWKQSTHSDLKTTEAMIEGSICGRGSKTTDKQNLIRHLLTNLKKSVFGIEEGCRSTFDANY